MYNFNSFFINFYTLLFTITTSSSMGSPLIYIYAAKLGNMTSAPSREIFPSGLHGLPGTWYTDLIT